MLIVDRFLAFFRAIARRKLRFVALRRDKAEELSEPSVVEIANGRVYPLSARSYSMISECYRKRKCVIFRAP